MSSKSNSGSIKRVLSFLRSLDSFGNDIGFTIESGRRRHGSIIGTIITGIIFVVVTAYGIKGYEDVRSHN